MCANSTSAISAFDIVETKHIVNLRGLVSFRFSLLRIFDSATRDVTEVS